MSWSFLHNKKQLPSVAEVRTWLPPLGGRVERILLLSDIHANWHALTAILEKARGTYNAVWFLGDICDYGPRPIECVTFLMESLSRRGRWVVGNHDLALVGKLRRADPNASLGDSAGRTSAQHHDELKKHPLLWDWCQMHFHSSRAGSRRVLPTGPKLRRYGEYDQIFVHAVPDSPIHYYLYPSDYRNIRNQLNTLLERNGHSTGVWLLGGHTHMVTLARLSSPNENVELLPITYDVPIPISQGAYYINPGSVGQPRDGDPRAAYAILDARQGTVTYRRVKYDMLDVQVEMRQAGYPNELIERLSTANGAVTGRYFDPVYTSLESGVELRSNL
ncbi:MAG: metallophosphatase family protein [Anaerolineae bacterium]|nr:metallophosphatase family protein [Anaerolineae bacterium]